MPLLTEKYRPQKLEDMIGFVPSFSIDEDIPHLLFHGGAGTGKTTAAKVIIRMLKCDYIILNASEERGIDVIRQKVMAFAGTQSRDGNIKIVLLDEADFLTNESQTALRNILETYSKNTRFILTCNFLQKIIDPIQSRCLLVKFDTIHPEDITKRLEYICKNENIPYDVNALNKIVENSGIDIRSCINKIEEMKDGVFLDKLNINIKISEEIFVLLTQQDFISARQRYLDSHLDPEQFMKDIYSVIFNSSCSVELKKEAILMLSEEYRWLSSVAWPQILIESFMIKIMKIIAV